MKTFLYTAFITTMLVAPAHAAERASAEILNGEGAVIGQADFVQGTIGVLAEINVSDLPPGAHGFHLHSVGTCDPDDHFKSASGHIGLKEGGHGYLNPKGPEKGDLPNLMVHEDGSANLELFLPQLNIDELLDEDGSALMVHENPDDHITQPIGGAGARIACGVVKAVDAENKNEEEK